MQVRDLIHLLQTRAKPDQEIMFTALCNGKEKGTSIQVSGESSQELCGVYSERTYDEDEHPEVLEETCFIMVSDIFINNLLVSIYDGEIDLKSTIGRNETCTAAKI